MSRPAQAISVFAFGAGCAWSLAVFLSQGAQATPIETGGVEILQAYVDPGVAGFVIVTVLGFLSSVGYWARSHIGRLRRRLFGPGDAGAADDAGGEAREEPEPTARDGEDDVSC